MRKLINWICASNHWRHILICFVLTVFLGAVAGLSAGVAAEWKDKQWGGRFDWWDIVADMVGITLGSSMRYLLGCGIC